MNFLAHALLAGPRPADRLGAMLGDFVKGPLPAGLSPDVAAGVMLHRRIDSFADAHPAFQRTRRRVSPLRRRYAGIMGDLFYDHFLALHWDAYGGDSLEEFSAAVYRLLEDNIDVLPPRLARIFPWMREDDWLSSYRELSSIHIALDRMATRFTRPNRLAGAAEELEAGYAGFEADFREFFPDARDFAAACGRDIRAQWGL